MNAVMCFVFVWMALKCYHCEIDTPDADEYCISETFRPACSTDEIIFLKEATLGRKRIGRCLEENELSETNMADRKFLGCYANVMSILEPLCSLKKFCEVRVAEIVADVPCYKYLRWSLEVQHACIRVIQENRLCGVKLLSDEQHLLVSKSVTWGCGGAEQPWIVESLPGQQISTRILSIPYTKNNDSNIPTKIIFSSHKPSSDAYGYVVDRASKKKVYVEFSRRRGAESFSNNKESFVSDSNVVEIHIRGDFEKNKIQILLSLEATGCSDLIPPTDAWLKRTENEATIGCYSTRLRWKLKCVGQRWIGVIGNCSQGAHFIAKPEVFPDGNVQEKAYNQTIAIFLIIASGLVLCTLITCIGTVVLRRYYAVYKSKTLNHIVNMNGKVGNGAQLEENGLFPTNRIGNFHNDGKTILANQKLCDENDAKAVIYQESMQYFELEEELIDKK